MYLPSSLSLHFFFDCDLPSGIALCIQFILYRISFWDVPLAASFLGLRVLLFCHKNIFLDCNWLNVFVLFCFYHTESDFLDFYYFFWKTRSLFLSKVIYILHLLVNVPSSDFSLLFMFWSFHSLMYPDAHCFFSSRIIVWICILVFVWIVFWYL